MYNALAEIPVPTSAAVVGQNASRGTMTLQVNYSVKDQTKFTKRTLSKSFFLSGDEHVDIASTPLSDVGIIAQVPSPSKALRAVWRGTADEKFVEIWKGNQLVIAADVSQFHNDFYADEYLSTFAWSPSERSIAYTAEGKPPKDKGDFFQRFRFRPDFGEGLLNKRRPTTFILSWNHNFTAFDDQKAFRIYELDIPVADASVNGEPVRFGQFVFSPVSDNILYATGYEFTYDGRILGPLGCFNRPTGIWRIGFPPPVITTKNDQTSSYILSATIVQKITGSNISCRSPRTIVRSDGTPSVYWLAAPTGGPHISATHLYVGDIAIDKENDASGIVAPTNIQVSNSVSSTTLKGFPGFYTPYNLSSRPFLVASGSSSDFAVIQTQWGCRTVIVRVNLKSGDLLDITDDASGLLSWHLLATDGKDRIVCSRSSPSTPYEVVVGRLRVSGKVAWTVIDTPGLPDEVRNALRTIQTDIEVVGTSVGDIETIVIRRKNGPGAAKDPCITQPHGGPHAASSTAFSPTSSALVLEGYTLNMPNYVGSTGYGDKFIQDLVGKCGDYDVEGTILSARHLVEKGISEEGPGKQFVSGGSHGGFLTAHLIGAYPDFFSGAALRNPVIVCGDISSTDIPDWYFAEFGLDYPIPSLPQSEKLIPPLVSDDTFALLQAASPLQKIGMVKVPVYIFLGASDRRVSNVHGIAFYHALKARYGSEGEVQLFVFEGEGHPLDGVETATATFELMRDLFGRLRK